MIVLLTSGEYQDYAINRLLEVPAEDAAEIKATIASLNEEESAIRTSIRALPHSSPWSQERHALHSEMGLHKKKRKEFWMRVEENYPTVDHEVIWAEF